MEFDLTSIAQLAALSWVLGEFVFRFISLAKKYKQLVVMAICVILGVAAKLTGEGFVDVSWFPFVVNLVLSIIGAQFAHDIIANPRLIKGK